MDQQARFFTNTKRKSATSLNINLNEFTAALKNGDSSVIDSIVEHTKAGLRLDKKNGYAALDLALTKHDFTTAKKLITAGAPTETSHEHRVEEYDETYDRWCTARVETRYASLFAKFGGDPAVLSFLHKNASYTEDDDVVPIASFSSNASALK